MHKGSIRRKITLLLLLLAICLPMSSIAQPRFEETSGNSSFDIAGSFVEALSAFWSAVTGPCPEDIGIVCLVAAAPIIDPCPEGVVCLATVNGG